MLVSASFFYQPPNDGCVQVPVSLTISSPRRGRSSFSSSERGAVDGADVQPAVMASGGNRESSWRTARQRSAHPGCHGRDAAP